MSNETIQNSNLVDELQWRGLIADSTDLDELREQLKNPTAVYCGFDPTGDSLHAGHLVPLLLLRRFQLAGHKAFALAGGATGMIGDPRDVGERSMLTEERVAENVEHIKKQLRAFLLFEGSAELEESGKDLHPATLVNNADWIGNMSVIHFLRDLGKNFSLNTMLSRDTVKRRLAADGISYTEFSYMLLQANDFVHLHREHDVCVQVGGSDQWGNIVSGVDLVRRMDGDSVHGLTVPLVTDSEGKKFGKSTGGGNLWLDPELTSPYSWYQYFFNTADADVVKFLRMFTFLDREEIDRLAVEVAERPFKREAQRVLAQEMTALVHGEDAVGKVELAAQALFGRADLSELDEQTLAAALQETTVAEGAVGASLVELLVAAGLEKSNGAARRTIKEGGAYVNNERIDDAEWTVSAEDLLVGGWLVLRKGKKNFAGAKISS
ncbi:tyrosine--tRNA ligase [Corynebacterium sp. UMB9976]|uniref:tyrosine--tRNA ligase n=1 Tax=Corynebacterium sp. UMB9976 TaxID=3046354 RepID=UPI002551848D|nr:tyrosine--tRNA ligase [Corynebacterium sp. UMB9976]MDK6302570.1 tyrosine--tRNA ligase [Corynebacterium sp. UMB9976]